jgi:periplasmic protein TonB
MKILRTVFACMLVFAVTAAPAAAQESSAGPIERPLWARQAECPDRFWPTRARQRGVEGLAVLDCLVIEQGALSCQVVAETPEGEGFGEAATRLAGCFRMQPYDADGQPTTGRRYALRVPFRFAD